MPRSQALGQPRGHQAPALNPQHVSSRATVCAAAPPRSTRCRRQADPPHPPPGRSARGKGPLGGPSGDTRRWREKRALRTLRRPRRRMRRPRRQFRTRCGPRRAPRGRAQPPPPLAAIPPARTTPRPAGPTWPAPSRHLWLVRRAATGGSSGTAGQGSAASGAPQPVGRRGRRRAPAPHPPVCLRSPLPGPAGASGRQPAVHSGQEAGQGRLRAGVHGAALAADQGQGRRQRQHGAQLPWPAALR